MIKINELTPQQKKDLVKYRDEWTKIGVSTGLTDKPLAEKSIAEMYKLGACRPPTFVWCSSPIDADAKVNATGGLLKDKRVQYYDWRRSILDASWIAFSLYCRDVLKAAVDEVQSKSLDLDADIAKSVSAWLPFENYCFVVDKPSLVNINKKSRLHSHTAPVVQYSDGFTLYAINGVIVDAWVITNPERITPKMFRGERYTEKSKALQCQYRWYRKQIKSLA